MLGREEEVGELADGGLLERNEVTPLLVGEGRKGPRVFPSPP